ncbi:MAG TPA: small ribosomal subunit Rsm22 family protein [Mycobacteriales bacterium]|nr:small ribosomal subunit Rsm22 family protein [Mycobacteriales bacterium]
MAGTELDAALAAVLGDGAGDLQRAVAALTAAYRTGVPPGDVLGTPQAARAYAAYRMPATYAAVRAALRAAGPGLGEPGTLLDLGGGTGAAVWAAAATLPSLRAATVLDRSRDALALGRALAGHATAPLVTGATWTLGALGGTADLVTVAYVLGELPEGGRALVEQAAAAPAVAIVEPGTPAGHQRVLRARDILLRQGFSVVAPCPHDRECPWAQGPDWCHFAARLPRSALHRQVKGGTLGWEDEKFSYVVAVRGPAAKAAGRIVRHPYRRKGLVELAVCADGIETVRVSRRQGPVYQAAKDAGWGDPWSPAGRSAGDVPPGP